MLHWYLYLKNLVNFSQDEEGQDLVEYALLIGLISLIAVGAITTAGTSVGTIWAAISTMLADAVAALPA